ncbi:Conserved hypothetical protein [Yarrowia lipolytica]|nr:Conserved hypothetical protein [Yarrowia lipolytica]
MSDIEEILEKLESTAEQLYSDLEGGKTGSTAKIELVSSLMNLQVANYAAQEEINKAKEDTNKERQALDLLQLDIQNIKYQHEHLRQSIEGCNRFKSTHEDLQLVDMGDFASRHKTEGLDDHQIMIERLKDERDLRLQLFVTMTELNRDKSKLVDENNKRKNDLDKLDASLSRFIAQAEPIRDILEQ